MSFVLGAIFIIAGATLVWIQYDYMRVVTSRTGKQFPVIGLGLVWFLRRPWRILSGFDDMLRSQSATQPDPSVELARRLYIKRRRLVLLFFVVFGGGVLLLWPELDFATSSSPFRW